MKEYRRRLFIYLIAVIPLYLGWNLYNGDKVFFGVISVTLFTLFAFSNLYFVFNIKNDTSDFKYLLLVVALWIVYFASYDIFLALLFITCHSILYVLNVNLITSKISDMKKHIDIYEKKSESPLLFSFKFQSTSVMLVSLVFSLGSLIVLFVSVF
ncbi:MAG: hypothetical protein CMB80_10875 [Flammeovirgaceae bacterium]|nr:hypothetical protein [Flammeovirgaceae bacterium]MBE61069.1 hypothetical protein [Flammeovirgaceae bacterium]MBR10770.1 hypothetical protein [Rickettsiales bacterium]